MLLAPQSRVYAMTSAAFDTLSVAKRLIAVGVERRQAEVHAEAIRDAMAENAATKADVAGLETRITAEVASLETRITAEVANLNTRIAELKVTMLLAVFGAAGLLFAALKAFGGAAS